MWIQVVRTRTLYIGLGLCVDTSCQNSYLIYRARVMCGYKLSETLYIGLGYVWLVAGELVPYIRARVMCGYKLSELVPYI